MFAVIDQQAAARDVGLDLRETTLVIFGNPAAGTRVMDAVPLAALDLPLKVLVWADGDGGPGELHGAGRARGRYGLTAEQAAAFEGHQGTHRRPRCAADVGRREAALSKGCEPEL